MSAPAQSQRKPAAVATASTYGIYIRNLLSMKVPLKMNEIGSNTKSNLERKIKAKTEGRCIPEGFIRPNSVNIRSYSAGVLQSELVEFQVVYECLVCNPVEGMIVECIVKSITKAGIHAEVATEGGETPIKVFIARDHNYNNAYFSQVKENMKIKAKIIGKKYELDDAYITTIATLYAEKAKKVGTMPGISLGEEADADIVDIIDEP